MAAMGTSAVVECEQCETASPVVEVDDHGRVFYGVDCPRCGLHVPHAPRVDDAPPDRSRAGRSASSTSSGVVDDDGAVGPLSLRKQPVVVRPDKHDDSARGLRGSTAPRGPSTRASPCSRCQPPPRAGTVPHGRARRTPFRGRERTPSRRRERRSRCAPATSPRRAGRAPRAQPLWLR
jgi:hypothetical protein